MGEANKRGTKEERIKAAIERDNAVALEGSRQRRLQPRKKFKRSDMMMAYAYMLNTMFYDDHHDYLRRNYYGPSK